VTGIVALFMFLNTYYSGYQLKQNVWAGHITRLGRGNRCVQNFGEET